MVWGVYVSSEMIINVNYMINKTNRLKCACLLEFRLCVTREDNSIFVRALLP